MSRKTAGSIQAQTCAQFEIPYDPPESCNRRASQHLAFKL